MEQLKIIRTTQELEGLYAYLTGKDYVAFDTETTGLDNSSEVIGFSISSDPKIGYYVILSEWDVEKKCLNYLETKEHAPDFMRMLLNKNLIMHNAVFDCNMVRINFGVELMPALHTDTLILGHLLDENRRNGLKDLGTTLFGESATKEQQEMKASIERNGGIHTKAVYELYKADSELIARYGAKDAILTYKLFEHFLVDLYEEGLETFFYEEESMPLLKGPTYDLNTVGLKVDVQGLDKLRCQLEADCMEARAYIYQEINTYIADLYPGTSAKKTFNIGSTSQLAWLLFEKLGNPFNTLTDQGKELCEHFELKLPYTMQAKRAFIQACKDNKDRVWVPDVIDRHTGKVIKKGKKVLDFWRYVTCGKSTLALLSKKYKWVDTLLNHSKNKKLLNTYVTGIRERQQYGIIRPQFNQHGTTSGRYSSKQPNFQNLPRDDKRIKRCITARPGKVLVGADYAQLEPRVFASFSGDERLLASFKNGDDFYSVIGMEVFDKYDCSLKKDDKDSFAKKYPKLRDIAKVVALSSTYGTTAPRMAPTIDKSIDEAQEIIDEYFLKFPRVKNLMLESHEQAKTYGKVVNLFGRPRRMVQALEIPKIFGTKKAHSDLPYEYRNLLNLAINHRIQSTGASIMNRAAIAFWTACRSLEASEPLWSEVRVILQVHDELVVEGPESLAQDISDLLKHCMEKTVTLPGVDLIAEPKIGNNLAELK